MVHVPHVLYYSPVACSLAPHILLEEVGIPFEARPVILANGEHHSAAYRAINPRERVPTLLVGDVAVTEVPALLAYIASLRPEAGLVPAPGTLEYARCFELLAFLSSSVHIAYAQFRRPERFLPRDFHELDSFAEQGRQNTIALYREIEDRVGSVWAIGGQYSIADPYLLPFYFWGERIGLDIEQDCPRWAALTRRLAERPAVRRALEREGLLPLLERNSG